MSWETLATALTTHAVRESKEGRLWSPASYAEGTTRLALNVTEVSCLVADIDHKANKETLQTISKALNGISHAVHSSFQHTPDHYRFRVVVPLRTPALREEWPDLFERWRLFFMHCRAEIDTVCSDPSHMFYLPSCPKDGERIAFIAAGEPLDPDPVLPIKPDPPKYKAPKFTHNAERPAPNIILSHAVQRAFANGNREAHAFWFAQQMRDNGYSKEETTHLMKAYHAAVQNWGDHPFALREAMGGLSAYGNAPRKPWQGRDGDASTSR